MMKRLQAFTLLEVLIALTLSSFILLTLTQSYRGAMRFLQKGQETMSYNRKVCLLFNQLERDLSCAFIPILQKEIKPQKDEKKQAPELKKPETKEEQAANKKKE